MNAMKLFFSETVKINILIIITSFGLISGFCSAQDKANEIDALVKKYAENGYIHGAILVADNGNIIYKNAFGYADIGWDIRNSVNTKFRIYSMTKPFTALLVMQLVEAGKIDLNANISQYLPYYRKDTGNQITVHHLLTHTHGINEGNDKLPPFLIANSTQQMVQEYFSNNPDFTPGSRFRYSGLLGYVLLGAIIESVTGKAYKDVLNTRILLPLAMENTVYLDYYKITKNKANDYARSQTGFENRIQAYPVNANGASSIVSTVDDLYLFDQALYTDKLLSDNYLKQIFMTYSNNRNTGYGYGWYILNSTINQTNKTVYFHSGGTANIIYRSVDDKITIIILNNIRSRRLLDICTEIHEVLVK
jgi:CubicO group peptidase (beta-lactamase class C family)